MSALVKIRSERDRMSAVERRIADFMLENAHLLRDYSSQQLANALGISQSSVVKFSQKLGFKGYPDLKFAVGEANARGDNGDDDDDAKTAQGNGAGAPADQLWRRKSEAEEATRSINPQGNLGAVAKAIG
ncbi:MAG: transcriptional regulator, partial [Proteobacteria bacterium]|nr:transcriptional regulator [Pseudomonadota bacterium]